MLFCSPRLTEASRILLFFDRMIKCCFLLLLTPRTSINSHRAGSAQPLKGYPDRHCDIPSCHHRWRCLPGQELTPRELAASPRHLPLSP